MPGHCSPSGSSLCLPRARRIQEGRDFLRLKTEGRRLVSGCLILNWMPRAEGSARRLGVVTSQKVGISVQRARARRLLREAWRRNQHRFVPGLDMVLVARASIVGKNLAGVELDFSTALRRAGLLIGNEPRCSPGEA